MSRIITVFFILFNVIFPSTTLAQNKNLVGKSFGNIKPNGFIKNCGQVNTLEGKKASSVLYYYNSSEGDVFITTKGISYVYQQSNSEDFKVKHTGKEQRKKGINYSIERIDANFINANIDTNKILLEYIDTPAYFNFYSKDLTLESQTYIKKITIKDIYPDIDWIIYVATDNLKQKLKYDFLVKEKGDANNIKIKYSSNAHLNIELDGSLHIIGKLGLIKEGTPVGYNLKTTGRKQKVKYTVDKNNQVTFDLNQWADRRKPYVIDPDLYWGTFLHTVSPYNGIRGSIVQTSDVKTDSIGNIFVALNCSRRITFPTLNPGGGAYYSSVYDSINGANVFMKFNENGRLLWSTYFASGPNLAGQDPIIAIDRKGNLIAFGRFLDNVPLKNNGGYFDSSKYKTYYASKFNNSGILLWSTYFSANVLGGDIDCDDDNNFYITGSTQSNNVPQKNPGNGAYFNNIGIYGFHPFISKFDENCNLIWSTDIYGIDNISYPKLAIDKNKNVYLTSGIGTFKFNSNCQMINSTQLKFSDIAVDTSGYLFGIGYSAGGSNFTYVNPGNGAYVDPNPSNLTNGGAIYKLDTSFKTIWATTYFGGKTHFFYRIVYEKYRNLIHILGYMNDNPTNFKTINDACNGSYYFSSSLTGYFYQDPIMISFATTGNLIYATLNRFPSAVYQYGRMAVDYKGSLIYTFSGLEEAGSLINFPTLKNPGNGAFYEAGNDNYLSDASILMKLTPTVLGVTSSIVAPSNCNTDGAISVIPNCGSGNYKYQWNTGDTTASIGNIGPGRYTLKITDISSGSIAEIPFNLPNPIGNIQSANFIASNSYCGNSNGSIKINSVNGGSGSFVYSVNNRPFVNNSTFSNLSSGNYIIKVKDNMGCIITDSVTVSEVAGPKKQYISTIPTACALSNGQISIDSISGGTKPYNYVLNNTIFSLSGKFTSLDSSIYLLTTIDSAGCKILDTIKVSKTKGPSGFTTVLDNKICGQVSGGITIVNVSGGVKPYTYSINNSTFSADSSFSSLTTGTKQLYVKDKNGCIYSDSVQLMFKQFPIVNLPNDTTLCNNDSLLLNVEQQGASYLWQDGTASNRYLIRNTGIYSVQVTKNACTTTDTIKVSYQKTPFSNLSGLVNKCIEDTLSLDIAFPQSAYLWQDGNINSKYNIVSPGMYRYKISNFCGSYSNVVNVTTYACLCNPIIPNAFSPNGDGINDGFKPTFSCNPSFYQLLIFNRNGQVIFETKNSNEMWDGRYKGAAVPVGTYYYILRIRGISDTLIREKSGSVTIIR